ncbi:MAG: UTP--glucose-1-phosphate uridylyltransferase, partial [bacterium]|nr:UTP--glucose-1-phosphate uridylyltransferase [bacterium]
PELEELLIERGKKTELAEVRRISNLARFVYVRQNKPLGNGHAILCAKEVVGDEPFVVAFGDDIIDAKIPATLQCTRVFERYGDTVIGVTAVPKERVGGYGIVQPKERGATGPAFEMKGIVEKPNVRTTPSLFGVRGRYVFTPAIFEALEKTKAGKGGEIWIADAIRRLLGSQAAHACVMEGTVYDCGNKLDYVKAQVAFAIRRPDIGKEFRKFLATV